MQMRWLGIGAAVGLLTLSLCEIVSVAQEPATAPTPAGQPAAGAPAEGRGARGARGGGRGARGGRGAADATPSKPTPRWPDGRVNLSQAPGIKGFWNVASGSPIGPGGLPGNLTLDQVPFQDWARALYD